MFGSSIGFLLFDVSDKNLNRRADGARTEEEEAADMIIYYLWQFLSSPSRKSELCTKRWIWSLEVRVEMR